MDTRQEVAPQPNLVLRWATGRGDLVMTWRGELLEINGLLATGKERERLQEWAKKHNLKVRGKLGGRARITADPGFLRDALKDLVAQEIGEAGYMVYGVTREGEGKVLAQGNYTLEELEEVAKLPQVAGGG